MCHIISVTVIKGIIRFLFIPFTFHCVVSAETLLHLVWNAVVASFGQRPARSFYLWPVCVIVGTTQLGVVGLSYYQTYEELVAE